MADTKKVRIMARVGDPSNGVIIQPGAVIELPEVWADRYIANGSAELVEVAKQSEKSGEVSVKTKTSKTATTEKDK